MKDRMEYEYLSVPVKVDSSTHRVQMLHLSPGRQAKKELGLSSRQYIRSRKALRRAQKVEFTGPQLVDMGGLVT